MINRKINQKEVEDMERMRKTVLYLTSFLLLGCLGWVFFHALCTIPQAKNILKNRTVFPLILAGSIFLLLLFVKLADWCRSWKKHTLMKATAIVFLLILVLQFLYLYYVRYWVGYDNLLVLDEAWYMQTDGHISPDFYDSYFQRYPHNHPVTILLYWVLKAAGKLGVSGLYWPSHLLGLVSIDLALLFMWKLACETEDIHRGFLVAVLSLFDPIIYIWIPWHYTTVCLLPFLSAGIYFGWKTWKAVNLRSQIIYAACTGIFTAVGMRIRITEGILLIAFLIMAVCVKGWNRCRLAACLIPFLVICGLTWAGTGMLRNHYADFDSSDKAFPPAHFVMMGVGGDGTYKKKDVEFTARIPGEEAKTKADLQEAGKRIRNLGVKGTISLAGEKMLTVWQDGSCGFQSEWLYPLKDSRAFQYICGEKNDLFLYWVQIFYVMILFLTLAGTAASMISGRMGTGMLLRLVLLGNILFYLMWEAQNRYSIGMVGILLFLAADGCRLLQNGELETEHIVPVLIRKRGWGAVTAILAVMLAILLYRPLFVEETEWREFSVRNIYRVGQNLQDIVSGDRVTQTFVASSAFDHILVQGYLKNGAVPDGGCQMLIQDEEGKKLEEAFLSAQQIAETQLDFTFDPIVPDGETVYTIVIEPKGIRENHALQLYRFNSSMDLYPAGKLSCNGREEKGNLIFSVYEERTGTIFRRIFL